MKPVCFILSSLALLALMAGAPVRAQLAAEMAYQGYLENGSGPVNNPAATLTFRIYNSADGGSVFWMETHKGVAVENGLFNVLLGSIKALPSTFTQPMFLSVAVGGAAAAELSPRTKLAGAPYAMGLAAPARINSPGSSAEPALWVTHTGMTSIRAYSYATSGPASGVEARSTSIHGAGVEGRSQAASGFSSAGVRGIGNTDGGYGVHGISNRKLGLAYGIFGQVEATGGIAVYGLSQATSGNNAGIFGDARSPNGAGVRAWNTAGTGTAYAISGISHNSLSGVGIYGTGMYLGIHGKARATSTVSYGLFGESNSTGVYGRAPYIGVLGIATGNTSAIGAYGETKSPVGRGVYALASSTSGENFALYARTESRSQGYAGLFVGKVRVNGTLSKAGGSFEIDHPLDPERRILRHSFVESPDMMNVYNGNVVTDAAGEATVELPGYFEALNTDYRYQLTAIGTFTQVMVAREIQGNRFLIATGEPNVKVSWQVTGIRRDAWAEANRIVVEEEKPRKQKGKYLYPEAHGRPQTLGIDYEPEEEANRAEREKRWKEDEARWKADQARQEEEDARLKESQRERERHDEERRQREEES